MLRQDYIVRQIEQLAQALAKIAGLREAGDLHGALEAARQGYRGLGLDPSYLRLDARSLVGLVGDKGKLLALARLLDEEALVQDAIGNANAAGQCRQRSKELHVVGQLEP